jgi:hypothetical protein
VGADGMTKITSNYEDANVICPFYKASDARRISCEGFVDGSTLIQSYPSKEKRDLQKHTFCDCKYKSCEVYKMLIRKYED